jgi:hypothetical protein
MQYPWSCHPLSKCNTVRLTILMHSAILIQTPQQPRRGRRGKLLIFRLTRRERRWPPDRDDALFQDFIQHGLMECLPLPRGEWRHRGGSLRQTTRTA